MFAKSLPCQGRDRDAKGENEREKAKDTSSFIFPSFIYGHLSFFSPPCFFYPFFPCSKWTFLHVAEDGAFTALVNYESSSFPLLGDMMHLDSPERKFQLGTET